MARARTTLVVDLALTAALMLLTALVLVTLCRDECYQLKLTLLLVHFVYGPTVPVS